MVYCGKPSAGCGACRARKVKCDQTKPACNRCVKTNRKCPGYRDQLSLLFRDETRAVAKKAIFASSSNPTSPSPSSLVPQRSSTRNSMFHLGERVGEIAKKSKTQSPAFTSTERVSNQNEIECQPFFDPFSIDHKFQATCFFFNSYAWLYASMMEGRDPHGVAIPTTPLGEKAMMNAIVSVGMANMSSLQGSHSLRLAAWREYSQALKWTNAAISDPTQAIEDSTLVAILCLSLFEILTCKKPEAVSDFVKHTKGAIALLELRGESQLIRQDGLSLFFTLRNEIIVSCLLRNYPVPDRLLALSEKATRLPNATATTEPGHQLTLLMAKLCHLRIRYEGRDSGVDTDLLSCAFALDSKFEAVKNGFPAEFIYDTVIATPGQSFNVAGSRQLFPLNGFYHEYPNWIVINMWNNYRYARIMLNGIILDQLKEMVIHPGTVPPAQDFKDLCYRVCSLVRSLASDICASVPCLLELTDAKNEKTGPSGRGLTLLFPLYIAATVDGPGNAMCDWAQDCLRIVGRTFGIDQALILADMLGAEESMTDFVDALHEQGDCLGKAPVDVEMNYDLTTYSSQ